MASQRLPLKLNLCERNQSNFLDFFSLVAFAHKIYFSLKYQLEMIVERKNISVEEVGMRMTHSTNRKLSTIWKTYKEKGNFAFKSETNGNYSFVSIPHGAFFRTFRITILFVLFSSFHQNFH